MEVIYLLFVEIRMNLMTRKKKYSAVVSIINPFPHGTPLKTKSLYAKTENQICFPPEKSNLLPIVIAGEGD